MVRHNPYALFFAALCLSLSGCSTSPTDSLGEFRATLYIEGFLVAGSPVDSIFVGATTPLYQTYSRSESGVPNATVALEVDGTESNLLPVPEKPGYYHLPGLLVESGRTYRLSAETEIGTVQAETTVPLPPKVTALATDLSLNSDDPFAAAWEGETAGGYFTTRTALSSGEPVPLDALFGGKLGGGFGGIIDTTQFAAMRDSLANVQQWHYVQSNSTTLDWRQFYRYGTYAFLVYSLDENFADYLVSSRQDPQALDEPQFHVSGGIGVFASMAADSVVFVVRE